MSPQQVRTAEIAEGYLLKNSLWGDSLTFRTEAVGKDVRVTITHKERGHTFIVRNLFRPLMTKAGIWYDCRRMINYLSSSFLDHFGRGLEQLKDDEPGCDVA